jgi:hypothetical protein
MFQIGCWGFIQTNFGQGSSYLCLPRSWRVLPHPAQFFFSMCTYDFLNNPKLFFLNTLIDNVILTQSCSFTWLQLKASATGGISDGWRGILQLFWTYNDSSRLSHHASWRKGTVDYTCIWVTLTKQVWCGLHLYNDGDREGEVFLTLVLTYTGFQVFSGVCYKIRKLSYDT